MTKFPRKVCLCCKRKLVGWKLIPIRSKVKTEAYLCYQCSNDFVLLCKTVDVSKPANKKKVLAIADKRYAKSVMLGIPLI